MNAKTLTKSLAAPMLSALVLGACLSAAAEKPPQSSGDLVGVASVIDGDTIEIRGTRIRLNGYDTPERGSMCGRTNVYQAAALALSDFIGSRNVECAVTGTDQYDRSNATCSIKGTDLGSHMVQNGWGRDWPRYSDGKYAADEKAAREAGKGLWGLKCGDGLWGNRVYD